MTLALYINEQYRSEIGTNTGWSAFRHWVETLNATIYKELVHLSLYGWSQNPSTLRTQLLKALKERTPQDINIQKTAQEFSGLIVGYPDGDMIVVTDHVGVEGTEDNGTTRA